MADNYVVKGKTSYVYEDTSALVGGLLAVLITLAAVAAFILWNKGRLSMFKRPSNPPATTTGSFDFPFYAQEVIMSNLEVNT